MKYRKLGRSGVFVSEISVGTWLTFGSEHDAAAQQKLIRTALDAGINLIDTADTYGHGDGERALRHALVGTRRESHLLATKCFFPMGDGPNDRGLSRKHVFESVEGSLQRLGVDYLDLFQCHRFDPETPLLETAQAMDDLCRQGKILYWGVSRWSADQLRSLQVVCDEHSLRMPISNQPCYNLLERDIEDSVIPACRELGLSQIVYSPLAQGVLTGKYQRGAEPPAGSRVANGADGTHIDRFLTDANLDRAQRVVSIARELDMTAPQLALAWCLAERNVATVLVGSRDARQLTENLGAINAEIPASAKRALDELTAREPEACGSSR